ncbi:MAG: hypothetical protein U9R15_04770 [Chloroflexota bacterium]|nr:hypothetical protein [Chloroflexota bacterium]
MAERGIISGAVFATPSRTLYTRCGDWFGWTMVVTLLGMTCWAVLKTSSNL